MLRVLFLDRFYVWLLIFKYFMGTTAAGANFMGPTTLFLDITMLYGVQKTTSRLTPCTLESISSLLAVP